MQRKIVSYKNIDLLIKKNKYNNIYFGLFGD